MTEKRDAAWYENAKAALEKYPDQIMNAQRAGDIEKVKKLMDESEALVKQMFDYVHASKGYPIN
jgi:hypothetical protein